MRRIPVAGGEIFPDSLGFTLSHEHIFVITRDMHDNYETGWDEGDWVERAAGALERAYAAGVRTVVDLTVVGLGRNVALIEKVAAKTKVNIVVATGMYTYDELPNYFRFRPTSDPDHLAEIFIDDILNGVPGTATKCAVLKCSTDAKGFTPGTDRLFRAVAYAHLQTGAPIFTHSDSHTRGGIAQAKLLAELGVDMTKVVIGHCGDSTDLQYLTELTEYGVTLGMDRFGLEMLNNTQSRMATVAELCRRGLANQMVLSHDAACYFDWMDQSFKEMAFPNWNYTHIPDTVIPSLSELGVTEEQIGRMLVDNPKRLLT